MALERLNKPEEKPNIQDPGFQEFANAGAKVTEPEPEKKREKIRLCFEIDTDINDAIEKQVHSRRTKTSKTQWVIKAILKSLKWKDVAEPPK